MNFGACGSRSLSLRSRSRAIVMGEDAGLAAAVPDALDHRGVVELVRQDGAAGHPRRQRADRGHVRDVARGEQQRRFLAMQVGQFALQQHVIVVGAGDVAGAAGAGAATVERFMHRRQHLRVLAHAEVIVRAPDGDLAGAARVVVLGTGKGARLALQVGEYAIASLAVKAFELPAEISFVVHDVLPLTVAAGSVPILRAVARSSNPCMLLVESLPKLVFKPLPCADRLGDSPAPLRAVRSTTRRDWAVR